MYASTDSMAQLIVRNLEDGIRDRLRALAAENGRSMEEEVREILRAAVLATPPRGGDRLGSRIAGRFGKAGLSEEIPELRENTITPPELDA